MNIFGVKLWSSKILGLNHKTRRISISFHFRRAHTSNHRSVILTNRLRALEFHQIFAWIEVNQTPEIVQQIKKFQSIRFGQSKTMDSKLNINFKQTQNFSNPKRQILMPISTRTSNIKFFSQIQTLGNETCGKTQTDGWTWWKTSQWKAHQIS